MIYVKNFHFPKNKEIMEISVNSVLLVRSFAAKSLGSRYLRVILFILYRVNARNECCYDFVEQINQFIKNKKTKLKRTIFTAERDSSEYR